ncbi:MAG: DUF853 family protein [Anaerolineae bacterium]|nr:DUF853 family protein [Anaerolineae bacterium]
MPFIDAPSSFYLGREVDPSSGDVKPDDVVYYDSRDLTTHGLIVGMTGSGKTGLALGLIEEAILDGVPAILVDPKGDLGNLLLTFPDFSPADFQPWVQEDEARRENMSLADLAAKKAEQWQKGLADWDITADRMRSLKASTDAEVFVYTPGSESGIPVSILASLRAPKDGFDADPEANREQIASLVTAILSLAGISAEPLSDPRHVLLSNIFEYNWRLGQDLTLETLIMQTQKPPFEKLGVMPLNDFFPEKDRFALAMALNAVIASPSFKAWEVGVPMDMQSLLYTPEGKPRVSIFYIAHLNDQERMFAMTLILETLLNWVRQQAGTESLRALLYIDEIFGFFPPVANPPSKTPLLRLLKQARAYGVGVVLATQNPVDLDYKGLSNIGTWWIGRLQTDNDRERVIAGLKEAASAGDTDLATISTMIANLKSRVFLMRNIHDKGVPTLMTTRWVMNYLAGPFTRQQIAELMAQKRERVLAPGAAAAISAASVAAGGTDAGSAPAIASDAVEGYSDQPPVLKGVQQFFLPVALETGAAIRKWETRVSSRADSLDDARLAFKPALLAQVSVLYEDKKADLRSYKHFAYIVPDLDSSGYVRWDEYAAEPVDKRHLDAEPRGRALFGDVPGALTDARRLKELSDDLTDKIYREGTLTIPYSETFGVYAKPDETESEFRSRLHQASRELRDKAMDDLTAKYDRKLDTLKDRLSRKERDVRQDEARVSSSNQKDITDIALGVFGALTGGRRSTSLSKIGRAASRAVGTNSAEAALAKAQEELAEVQTQLDALQREMDDEMAALEAKFDPDGVELAHYEISPYKKNIEMDVFALGWLPHWLFTADGRTTLAAAYEAE